jgi:membrane protease YdiL (CAAX protease family)
VDTRFFSGAFAEELWIAFCVATFIATGHSNTLSVLTTSVVFGATHFEYRFGALAVVMYGAVSALLFLWLGSLIPMFLFHFIGNLGSLYWARHR